MSSAATRNRRGHDTITVGMNQMRRYAPILFGGPFIAAGFQIQAKLDHHGALTIFQLVTLAIGISSCAGVICLWPDLQRQNHRQLRTGLAYGCLIFFQMFVPWFFQPAQFSFAFFFWKGAILGFVAGVLGFWLTGLSRPAPRIETR